MNTEKKNLLDLRHSLYSTKAALFFSIGVGGAIALFFGIKQSIVIEDITLPFLVANIWFMIFVWISIIHFSRCDKIQKEISDAIGEGKKDLKT